MKLFMIFSLLFLFILSSHAGVLSECNHSGPEQVYLKDCNLDIMISGQTYVHWTAGWERAWDLLLLDEKIDKYEGQDVTVPNDSCSMSFRIGDTFHYMCDKGLWEVKADSTRALSGKEWNQIVERVYQDREALCEKQ